jgi:tRNA pseudouridine13 synthase
MTVSGAFKMMSMKIKYDFWKKTGGIGGKITRPEDFCVDEVIGGKFLKRFERTGRGVSRIEGPYSLFILKKTNTTTADALKLISRHMKIGMDDIGYAGLKDKFAVTTQYVTIKCPEENLRLKNVSLDFAGKTNRHISVGDLEENRFFIRLRGCRNIERLGSIMKNVEKYGLPNYFGPQRFGKNRNNHEIGRLIIKKDFSNALKAINEIYDKDYNKIEQIGKPRLKFFIHAYQSWIFNEAIRLYVKNNKKPISGKASLFGRNTRLSPNKIDKATKSITEKQGIVQEDFSIRGLGLSCSGGLRSAFVTVKDLKYETEGGDVKLSFALPKGSYATVLVAFLE